MPATCDDWRQLAEAARSEEDPKKLMQLIDELNRKLAMRARELDTQSGQLAD